jgi:uncharacterized membrane protein
VIGGLIVLLPIGILIAAFGWIFGLVRALMRPLTAMVMAQSNMQEAVAIALVLGIILASCFLTGLLVRTRIGKWVHDVIERRILKTAPGYSLVKQTVLSFLGGSASPFSSVAFVELFGSDTMALGFVTDRHANGWYAVFIPTGPNPTSGGIFHVKPEHVHFVDHPVEDVMRTIISCGAGSAPIMKVLEDARGQQPAKVA